MASRGGSESEKGESEGFGKRFDVVVANIDFKSLKRLRVPLLRHLNERGLLILSGILREQEEKNTPSVIWRPEDFASFMWITRTNGPASRLKEEGDGDREIRTPCVR